MQLLVASWGRHLSPMALFSKPASQIKVNFKENFDNVIVYIG